MSIKMCNILSSLFSKHNFKSLSPIIMYSFTRNVKDNSKSVHPQTLLKKYDKIKQKQHDINNKQVQNIQQKYSENGQISKKVQQFSSYRVQCQGCHATLQSKDKTKYGYIEQKVLKESIKQNSNKIKQIYGPKASNSDAKILNFMHEVQKQSGIKIFNPENNKIQNLDNLQVIMRLQQKIQKYENQQQLLKSHTKSRQSLLCFRCYSLKYHNRLPEQYDNNLSFNSDTTQYILNKMLNRHKEHPCQYLLMVDAFDILGTFQEWLFVKLLENKLSVSVVVNKIDVVNKMYLNQTLLHAEMRKRVNQYMKNYYSKQNLNENQLKQKFQQIKIYYVSCTSRDGIKKLQQHLNQNDNNIQLVGYPNTGKTTLLNILTKSNKNNKSKSTSKIPGTTVKITDHEYKNKRRIYDMPGLYGQNLLYNLIQKPSIKAMLTWHKKISPGLLTNSAFIYGGRIEIPDTRIIIFGLGGACSSTNKWFIDNHKQFWKGLPALNSLKIKKHQMNIKFSQGVADDLQIAGYGFIGFRLCIPNIKQTSRTLTLYLPEGISFRFREGSILNRENSVFHNRQALTKKYMLERLNLEESQRKKREERVRRTQGNRVLREQRRKQKEAKQQAQQYQQQQQYDQQQHKQQGTQN